MQSKETETKEAGPRPYWHVDAKWISGIVLLFLLAAALLATGLVRLTDREPAVKITARLIALAFSPQGLDSPKGINEFRQNAAREPGPVVHPLPSKEITVPKRDVLKLPPRELRLRIFTPMAEIIYDRGAAGVAKTVSNDPREQQRIEEEARIVNVLTAESRRQVRDVWLVLLGLCAVAAVPLVYFSAGWGRLVSPGLVLLVAGIPALPLIGLAQIDPRAEGSSVMSEVMPLMAAQLGTGYVIALIAGAGLLAAAGIGKAVRTVAGRR